MVFNDDDNVMVSVAATAANSFLSSDVLSNSLHPSITTSPSPHSLVLVFISCGGGYLAVTIQRPSATLAASRALPASSKQKPISSRF